MPKCNVTRQIARALAAAVLLAAVVPVVPVHAGPPFLSDDAEPTDYTHFEIYAFANGTLTQDGSDGEGGIDFNYGATPDLQLTAVLPVGYSKPKDAPFAAGLGNIELAAKYRFLHQDKIGVDIAVFPRVFLPAGSAAAGERHISLLLPIWLEKDWGEWSAFGGGGCVLNRSGDSRNFCLAGVALTREVLPGLRLGGEIFHQGADTKDGLASTSLGAGAIYDVSDHYHLLGYLGRGIENARETGQLTWYSSILFTF